jgi:hypothetical protein
LEVLPWHLPYKCEKARKNLSQGEKSLNQVKKHLSQITVHILPKTPTNYKTLTNTRNIKPPQYKLKQNAYRTSNIMRRKDST